MSTVIQES